MAAYTGWNPRVPVGGLSKVLYEIFGSRPPLRSDVTLPDRTAYGRGVRDAADGLVGVRILLERDVDRTVEAAMATHDDARTNSG